MYCHKCGKEIYDKSEFCQFCGTAIYRKEKEESISIKDQLQTLLFSETINNQVRRYKSDAMYRLTIKKTINTRIIPVTVLIAIVIVGLKIMSMMG